MSDDTARHASATSLYDGYQMNVYIVGVVDGDNSLKWNRDAYIAHTVEDAKHQAKHGSDYGRPKVYHCEEVAADVCGCKTRERNQRRTA